MTIKGDPRHDMCMRDYACILVSFFFSTCVFVFWHSSAQCTSPTTYSSNVTSVCICPPRPNLLCVRKSSQTPQSESPLCVCVCVSQRGMSKEAKARVHICSNLPFQLSSLQPPLRPASLSTQNCKHLVEKTATILITLVLW